MELNIVDRPSEGQLTFGDRIIGVRLVPGDITTAMFNIVSSNRAGNYVLEVRIIDVRRPDGQGGSDSIADRVIIGSPVEITLTVTEPEEQSSGYGGGNRRGGW